MCIELFTNRYIELFTNGMSIIDSLVGNLKSQLKRGSRERESETDLKVEEIWGNIMSKKRRIAKSAANDDSSTSLPKPPYQPVIQRTRTTLSSSDIPITGSMVDRASKRSTRWSCHFCRKRSSGDLDRVKCCCRKLGRLDLQSHWTMPWEISTEYSVAATATLQETWERPLGLIKPQLAHSGWPQDLKFKVS